jgi:hypothetical protein
MAPSHGNPQLASPLERYVPSIIYCYRLTGSRTRPANSVYIELEQGTAEPFDGLFNSRTGRVTSPFDRLRRVPFLHIGRDAFSQRGDLCDAHALST